MVVLCCIVVVTGFLPFLVSRSSLSSPPSQVSLTKASRDAALPSTGAILAEQMEQAYLDVKLIPHQKKSFRDELHGSFWGADVNGEKGTVRGSLKRAIPLCGALLQVSQLGHVSVELLQSLVGSLVSLFLFRRRMLCLLDAVYQTCQGRRGDSLVKLSGRAKGELLMSAILLPLACTNMRAPVSPRITATDSSSWWECSVVANLPSSIADELCRHSLRKSVWSRLLAPGKAWLRCQGELDSSLELPEPSDEFVMNPLWQILATGLQYREFLSRKSPNSRHINIGELRAYLAAEKAHGLAKPSSRELFALDSQVVLGLLSKGRSASPSLNWELSKSLPSNLGLDLYQELFYFETSKNPSDDPTRGRTLRAPSSSLPDWWQDLSAGDFSSFDSWLAAHELDDHSMSGLPDFSELGFDARSEPKPTSISAPVSDSRVDVKSFPVSTEPDPTLTKEVPPKADASSPFQRAGDDSQVEPIEPGLQAEFCDEAEEPYVFVGPDGPLSSEDSRFVHDFLTSLHPSQIHGNVQWPPTSPGYLDLFSGEKGVVKSWCKLSGSWGISYEILDSPGQDLNCKKLRAKLLKLLRLGIFKAFGAAPVCSSFSVAITPPVRSSSFPYGKPDVSEKMLVKIEEGNSSALWILEMVKVAIKLKIPFWVENPDLSFLFRLPEWTKVVNQNRLTSDFWRFDQCLFFRKWRKRTRVYTNTSLKGRSLFCKCGAKHIALRGRSSFHRMSWTRVAQAYPVQLCKTLSYALALTTHDVRDKGGFDGSQFARCCHRRIGEAKNPGPPQRNLLDLDDVRLVEAKTEKLQSKIWAWFLGWLGEQISPEAVASSVDQPELLCLLVSSFGRHLFSTGKSQYVFRHLVVFVQKSMPLTRPHISRCWELLQKWERLEPTIHRAPLPSSILRAMVVVALHWRWWRFSGCLLACFFGILRPGEFLKATRRDMVLPRDLIGEDRSVIFLRISEPKSRFRGRGRVQHASIHEPGVVSFLQRVFGRLNGDEKLYDISAGSFRRRWDCILQHLNISRLLRITPGSLRAGGAIFEYRRGTDLTKLLWRMRLKQLSTLESYVQEVASDVVFSDLLAVNERSGFFLRFLTSLFQLGSSFEPPSGHAIWAHYQLVVIVFHSSQAT